MKKVLISIVSLFIIGIVYIFSSGNTYLFKAWKNTYLSGSSKASIFDKEDFELATVSKGSTQEWQLSPTYNQKKLNTKITSELENQESVALLVFQKGKLDFEKYWGKGGINVTSNSFSMAKSVVSTLIGIAMKDNKIDNVFQPVTDFLPDFGKGLDKEKYFNHKLEIRHLLSMQAGLEWEEVYSKPSSTVRAYYGDDIKNQMLSLKVVKEPGSEYVYQSGATQLLAMILEKATGTTLAEYASQKLWKPLGARTDATWHLEGSGEEIAFCCLNSTARDFARIGQLYLQKGKWNGQSLVPAPYIDIATQASNKEGNYGYQWWIESNYSKPFYYMQGFSGQYVAVIPEMDLVIVRLGEQTVDGQSLKIYVEEIIKMYS